MIGRRGERGSGISVRAARHDDDDDDDFKIIINKRIIISHMGPMYMETPYITMYIATPFISGNMVDPCIKVFIDQHFLSGNEIIHFLKPSVTFNRSLKVCSC